MRFYVGTYSVPGSPGLALCKDENGRLTLLDSYDALRNPTYLIPSQDGQRLFVVAEDEQDQGVAVSFCIAKEPFAPLSACVMDDARACHLALNDAENVLYTAHYHQGSLAVLAIDSDGRITRQIQQIQHHGRGAHPTRQEKAHVHHVAFRPGTQELFVCDLGIDQIIVYTAAPDGMLTEKQRISVPAGTGPRHLVFRNDQQFYVAGELSSTVLSFALDDEAWTQQQCLSTLPQDGDYPDNTCAAIRLADSRLYVSNRGADNIAAFEVDASGRITPAGHIPCHGQSPRDFVVTPYGFLCANQFSGTVTAVAHDGTLLDTLPIPGAVCICPV